MGAAADSAFRCSTVVRAVLKCLPVEDIFSCARYDALWEEVALPLLRKRLRFFALLQECLDGESLGEAFKEELEFRLRTAQRAQRHPAVAIAFCSCKYYDGDSVASCFPEDTAVVQLDVTQPVLFYRGGPEQKRWAACLCVLVLFHLPGACFQCEWAPCESCLHTAAFKLGAKRRHQHRCPSKVAFIHKETGQRARFAFYASSAYDQTTFRTPPILNYVAGCMLWTTRLRLLRPVLENSFDRPVLWGSVLFGHAVTATSVKFPALATIRGMSRHLESVRQNFSDAEEKTLVLYFQNDKLDVDVSDAICKVFRGATAVLGAPTSLTLDVKPFVTDLQQDAGDWTSPRLLTAVLVVVLGFR